MTLTQGIIFGLIAMLAFGISKLFMKKPISSLGSNSALFYHYIVDSLFLISIGLFLIDFTMMPLGLFMRYVISVILGALAIYFFFRSLDIGKVSLVTPISHSSVVLTVVLALVFYKEVLSTTQLAGIFIIILGIILISFRYSEFKKITLNKIEGFNFALLTLLGWGFYFFLIKPIILELGALRAAVYLEVGITIIIIIAIIMGNLVTKKRLSLNIRPLTKGSFSIILAGILSSIGVISFNYGVVTSSVSLSYTLAQASVLVAVIGSYFFLKERVDTNQKIAIFIIILGLVLVSL